MFRSASAQRSSLCVTALLVAVLSTPAWAQSTPSPEGGSLRVTVSDPQRLTVPGASCSLTTPDHHDVAVAVTDEYGLARFNSIAPGSYTLRVDLAGFDSASQSNVVVTVGAETAIDVTLSLALVADRVTVAAPSAEDTSFAAGVVRPIASLNRRLIKALPIPIASIKDVLPLVPGVVRSTTGEMTFNGALEPHTGLVINGMNAADPATGSFRVDLPVDSVEAVQVFLTPYTGQYGQFTGAITSVETKAGGDQWHFELNDFLPDFRFVNGRIHGVAEDTPHLNLSGPLLRHRMFFSQSAAYTIANRPVRGLEFPDNETRTESASSFTQLDIAAWPHHAQRVTVGYFPQRNDFVGLDVFRPRPVTPSATQRDAVITARDISEVPGGFLTSTFAISRFDTNVRPQGTDDLTLTPTTESGNYFATQNRQSGRGELFLAYTLSTKHWLHGSHDITLGLDANDVRSRLDFDARPVNIVRSDGLLAQRIEFDTVPTIRAHNREYVGFAQDRWALRDDISLDLGLRFENQQLADAQIIAPRMGITWAPTESRRTVVRGGVGLFYDKIPLNIRTFAQYPARVVTTYRTDGAMIDQTRFTNVLVDATSTRLEAGPQAPHNETEFVPENVSSNVQLDQTVNRWLSLRASMTLNYTSNIYIINPQTTPDGQNAIVLSSTGRSVYRSFELAGRFGGAHRLLNVAYTRSSAFADLNDFNSAFGDFASPLVRPNQYSRSATDVPHRLIAWGEMALPHRFSVAPVVEVRSGFPYSVRDAEQRFVGIRNDSRTRFPIFAALDLEVAKELQVTSKYSVRLSLKAFNLTNHFNPRDVHANVDDPEFGRFLASYRRYFAGGFDIIF
jgi:carboxypeptidase family protein/TonB-dependent receptor-like protein